MLADNIIIQDGNLPDLPGVYRYYSSNGELLYVGKAGSLKRRVASYFTKKSIHPRTAELVLKIAKIEYTITGSVLEALVLEANLIRKHKPPYNILGRDDKSFIYLCFTNEQFPRPVLMRGLDLERLQIKPFNKTLSPVAKRKFRSVYGPYLSSQSLKIALKLVRRSLPWSTCEPPAVVVTNSPTNSPTSSLAPKPCFEAQLGLCPGVCTGGIAKKDYQRTIKEVERFFDGQVTAVVSKLKREMDRLARLGNFEGAAIARNRWRALTHVSDVSLLRRDLEDGVRLEPTISGHLNIYGRIEAFDIAHLGGAARVGAMSVFEGGQPATSQYKRFSIRLGNGADDYAAMREILTRRLTHSTKVILNGAPIDSDKGDGDTSPTSVRSPWPDPDLWLIDGGEGQVSIALELLKTACLACPVVGIAKGPDRKVDRLVIMDQSGEIDQVALAHKQLLQRVRDEAHRFANRYHQKKRRIV
ncbi:MAG: GIY-YIG nuclease family protein [Patescibacteria group bacterium]